MTDLTPFPALAGALAGASARFGALSLTEQPDLALASLALRRDATRPAPFGLVLPGPGDWAPGPAADTGCWAVWAGPGQWLVGAEGRAAEDFATVLAAEAPGCSVTEQTDGWVAVELLSSDGAGPILAQLEKLVNLAPAALVPGKGTRCLMHHQSVVLLRRAEDRLTVLGPRSSAGSWWHHLTEVAARV